jgi:AraC-like DNA-binding protein
MGLSFGKFCRRARLAYAAQLLLTTDLPVEAVARTAGFSDASHLHHSFVETYGATPARYRADGRPLTGAQPHTHIEAVEVEDHRAPARYRAASPGDAAERPYIEIERLDPEDYDTPLRGGDEGEAEGPV